MWSGPSPCRIEGPDAPHPAGLSDIFAALSQRRRHARRTEIVPAPLYPSYLFVSFNRTIHRWRSIHSTVGVARLVCNGEAPAAIDSEIIDGLKSRENEQGLYPA